MTGVPTISDPALDAREVGRTLDDVAEIGNRYTGTPGESVCRDYLAERFLRAGLESVTLEPFECLAYAPVDARCSILGSGREVELECTPLQYSADADIRAPAVYIGDALAEDLARIDRAGVDLTGRVVVAHAEYAFDLAPVLVPRRVAALVHIAQTPDGIVPCSNAVMYPPPLRAPWPGRPLPYPGVTISAPAGRRLLSELSLCGSVQLRVVHRSRLFETTAHNVVGEIPGHAGPEGESVIVCAHYDSQADGPAVYDNGSGLAGLLEIARLLAGSRSRRRIVVLASAAEEIGLWGATAYAHSHERELRTAVAMINLDGVASSYPSRREIWSADARLRSLADETARRAGWVPDRLIPRCGTFSDHVAFAAAGVPSCLIWRPEHPYLVSRGDVRALVDEHAVAETAAVSLSLARLLAGEPEPFGRP